MNESKQRSAGTSITEQKGSGIHTRGCPLIKCLFSGVFSSIQSVSDWTSQFEDKLQSQRNKPTNNSRIHSCTKHAQEDTHRRTQDISQDSFVLTSVLCSTQMCVCERERSWCRVQTAATERNTRLTCTLPVLIAPPTGIPTVTKTWRCSRMSHLKG